MSDQDGLGHALEVTRRTALTGGAAGLAAYVMSGCGVFGGDDDSDQAARAQGSPAPGTFGEQKKMRFVFVNHVTTNPFFVPTRYGAEDACKLVNCSFQWTGSESANVNEMVNAFNSAISAKADGIAVCLVDEKAFNEPVQRRSTPASRSSATTRTSPNARLVVHRPGPVRLRAGDGQADRRPRRRGQRRAVHRDAGLAEHPAAHRRRDRRHQVLGRRDQVRRRSPPAPRSRRSSRRSTRTTSATRTSRACSPSTRAAPRPSRR